MEKQDWYLEYATGSVSNRNQLCRLEDFSEVAKLNAGGEIYRSMFLYSPDIVAFVAENNTVTGFNGIQAVDKIVVDIDYVKDKTNGDELTVTAVFDICDAMQNKGIS